MDYLITRSIDIDALYHHGVKGMKWGVRRYQNKDGSLNAKGIKRYAIKGYSQDSYNSNKSSRGKIYDRYTGANGINATAKYETSSSKANKARAEKYIKDKQAPITNKIKKALANKAANNIEKARSRKEKLHRTTDIFGVGGAAAGTYISTASKIGAKGMLAKTINMAANIYIASGRGNYYVNQGVHYARKAAIGGLSLSAYTDVVRGFLDVGEAYIYAATRSNKK